MKTLNYLNPTYIYGWTWASQLKVNLLFHIRKMDLELLSLLWLIVGCMHVALMLTSSSQPSLEIIASNSELMNGSNPLNSLLEYEPSKTPSHHFFYSAIIRLALCDHNLKPMNSDYGATY